MNPAFAALLRDRDDLRIEGTDQAGDIRIIRLPHHPFFVATLFQPERSSLKGSGPSADPRLCSCGCDRRGAATPNSNLLAVMAEAYPFGRPFRPGSGGNLECQLTS